MNFPEDLKPIKFVGTAISHFQSEPIATDKEGHNLPPASDWEFELWKNLQGKPSGIPNRQHIDDMPHFLELKETYIKRAKDLGQTMFCFSLDFGRLCPQKGVFNEELMAEYVKVLALIRIYEMEPLLTLNHFTMPLFLLDIDSEGKIQKGAWEHPDVLVHFKFFAEQVVAFLKNTEKIKHIFDAEDYDPILCKKLIEGGLVKYAITLNEPAVVALLGYINGTFPPFKKWNFRLSHKVMKVMVKAHDIAYTELKKLGEGLPENRKTQVGVGYTWQYFDGPLGFFAQKISEYYTDIFERDGSYSDFLGLHYYFRQSFLFFHWRRKKREYGDQPGFGDIYPLGILKVLEQMHKRYPTKDIFVSEIGFADAKGARRPYWLAHTLKHFIQAKEEGIPIKAILLWSLADNFEWDIGMNVAKFGLFSENQIKKPLLPEEGRLHSWEVWQKATKAMHTPSPEALADLEEYYERAKNRYYEEINFKAP